MNIDEILLCAAIMLAVIVLLGRGGKSAEAQRLRDVERKIDLLLDKAGVKNDTASGLPPGVAEALAKGDKIEAIKLYRGTTGVGLKEAKDVIEALPYKDVKRKLDLLLDKAGVKNETASGLPPGVAEALAKGDKIEAIKLYRGTTGVGLKEAKDFVEALPYAELERKTDALLKKAGARYDPACAAPPGVMEALSANNVIEAIKLYREATGVGLKEAKDAVEELRHKTVH